jgi:dTDP-4-amino-4,6-dideoxygalactose transaminase
VRLSYKKLIKIQMNVRFFNPGLEFLAHKQEYLDEYIRVREKGDLILREDVEKFEENLARYVGVKYAVGLNSGTDALLIALKAIGIKEGDEVLVPSYTFVATAQVVNQLGAIPVLYDIDETPTIDTRKVKAIIPTHISGELDLNMLTTGIPVIEDACQALGATFEGRKAGSFGAAAAFSFYPAKVLGAPGDAGALVTNDENIYKFALEYRNHWKSDYSKWGINSRLDNILAAELNIKLARLDKTLARRWVIAIKYLGGLAGFVWLPSVSHGRTWQDFIIDVGEDRDKLYSFLKDKGVETMKNEYPFPIPKLPKSLKYESETLRLPINEVLLDEEIDYVIEKIKEFYDTK